MDRLEAFKLLDGGYEYDDLPKDIKRFKSVALKAISLGKSIESAPLYLKNDKDFALRAVAVDGLCLQDLGSRVKNDKDVVLEAVKDSGWVIRSVNERFLKDFDVALEAVKTTPEVIRYIDKELANDTNFCLQCAISNPNVFSQIKDSVKYNEYFVSNFLTYAPISANKIGEYYQNLPEDLKKSPKIISVLLEQNGETFKDLPPYFRDKEEYLMLAMKSFPQSYIYASNRLRNSPHIAISAMENGLKYADLNKGMRENTEVLNKSIKLGRFVFDAAPDYLKDDPKFIKAILKEGYLAKLPNEMQNDLEAVELITRNAKNIKFLPDKILNNKDSCLTLVSQDAVAYKYIRQEFREDPDIIQAFLKAPYKSPILSSESLPFEFLPKDLQQNKAIISVALEQYPDTFTALSKPLRHDKELLIKSLECGLSIKNIPPFFRGDRDIANIVLERGGNLDIFRQAIKSDESLIMPSLKNGGSLHDVPKYLKNNRELVLTAFSSGTTQFLIGVSPKLQNDDEIVKLAIKSYPRNYHWASERLQNSFEMIKMAVSRDGMIFKDIPEDFRCNQELALIALEQNGEVYQHFPNVLKSDPQIKAVAIQNPISCKEVSRQIFLETLQAERAERTEKTKTITSIDMDR